MEKRTKRKVRHAWIVAQEGLESDSTRPSGSFWLKVGSFMITAGIAVVGACSVCWLV